MYKYMVEKEEFKEFTRQGKFPHHFCQTRQNYYLLLLLKIIINYYLLNLIEMFEETGEKKYLRRNIILFLNLAFFLANSGQTVHCLERI